MARGIPAGADPVLVDGIPLEDWVAPDPIRLITEDDDDACDTDDDPDA